MICLVGTGMFLSADANQIGSSLSVSPQQLSDKISQIADSITVKILDRDFLGSGFIAQKSGEKYLVVTNQHVLRAGDPPYIVETADGNTYLAKVVSQMSEDNYSYDLAILEFEAENVYTTAKFGSSLYLEVGEPIFAAGFPYSPFTIGRSPAIFEPSTTGRSSELSLVSGRITIILNQALEEGYQIGYTNDVKKGMSGGPLLNSQGQVVGINGKHAYPLWESPEVYQDGSEPCPALQKLITRSSLAIPIEKSIKLKPELKASKSPGQSTNHSRLVTKNSQLTVKMQTEAQKTQQQCEGNTFD